MSYTRCPQVSIPELALVGRSNVGKSSLVNMLLERHQLARTSNKPGKTQLINHFLINGAWHLVDLPGYGWARVSKAQRQQWDSMVKNYLLHRVQLSLVLVLADVRLGPQKLDVALVSWLRAHSIPFVVLLTKADKKPRRQVQHNATLLQSTFYKHLEVTPPIFVTSTKDKAGRKELLDYLQQVIGQHLI